MRIVRLAAAYLASRPLLTALNVAMLALGVATIAFLLLVTSQAEDRLTRDAKPVDLVVGAKGSGTVGKFEGYKPMVIEICKFFKTGKAPVSMEETIELFTFMEAADESKRQGGKPVKMEDVLKKAQAFNDADLLVARHNGKRKLVALVERRIAVRPLAAEIGPFSPVADP